MIHTKTYQAPPTIAAFMRDDSFFRTLMGPVGGGKSVACVMEIIRRCQQQRKGPDGYRHSRWAVVRNTMPQLKDTTLKTWFDWVPAGPAGKWKESERVFLLEFGDVRAEILFRPLDSPEDVRRVLSLELTGVWLNEAREIPREIVEALQGRLKRFPSMSNGGATWSGMIADTNPPEVDSYWYNVMEGVPLDPDNPDTVVRCASFKQPSGLSPLAENVANLDPTYYTELVKGKAVDWVDTYVHGLYSPSLSGSPVYGKVFKQNIHVSPRAIPVDSRLPVIVGLDYGLCYDDQTEVLTQAGWKFFKDVDPETDLAATRNPETKAFEYTPINFKVDRPYQGKLIGWKSTEVDFLVTPEHRIPYTRRSYPDQVLFAEAQWIAERQTSHLFVDLTSTWVGQPCLTVCGMDEEVYAGLMGWLASDGHPKAHSRTVQLCQVKPHEDLTELLAKTPFAWGKSNHVYSTSNQELHQHFVSDWGPSKKTRRVADRIKQATPRIIEIFLRAFTRGDGHLRVRPNGTEEWTIYAYSVELAGDLQELAQKCGWNSSLRIQPGQTSCLNGREIISTGGYIVTIKRRASRAELIKRNYYEVDYDGRIYCLNVPYHTLYIRRGGKPSWNGNTPAAVFKQMTPTGRIHTLAECVEFDMHLEEFIKRRLRPMIKNKFPTNPLVMIGDPSGVRRADSNGLSCIKLLKDEFKNENVKVRSAHTNDPEQRISATMKAFSEYPCGEPLALIDPSCKWLIEAYRSKYRYAKTTRKDVDHGDKPDKNKWSHVTEAAQYGDMFLLGGKYSVSDYALIETTYNPLGSFQTWRPATSAGY